MQVSQRKANYLSENKHMNSQTYNLNTITRQTKINIIIIISSILYYLCAEKIVIRQITETAQKHKKNTQVTYNKRKHISRDNKNKSN
jgi:hypothetical protein